MTEHKEAHPDKASEATEGSNGEKKTLETERVRKNGAAVVLSSEIRTESGCVVNIEVRIEDGGKLDIKRSVEGGDPEDKLGRSDDESGCI